MRWVEYAGVVFGWGLLLMACAPAFGLTLVNDPEDIGDGVLAGSGEQIQTNNTDGITFWWDDSNGDGTKGDNVSADLDMDGNELRRLATAQWSQDAAKDIVLNLDNGSGDGVITNGGDMVTSRGQYNYYSGRVVISNATHISLNDFDVKGETGGGLVVFQTGNLNARYVLNKHRGTPRAITLDGGNGGSCTLHSIDHESMNGNAQDITIRNYTGLSITGSVSGHVGYSIYAETHATAFNPRGDIIITNIGAAGVQLIGINTENDDVNATAGGGDVTIETSGNVVVSNLVTRHTIAFGGRKLDGGDVDINAVGDIEITGTVDLNSANEGEHGSTDGDLLLSATGSITVANLDLDQVGNALFDAGSGKSYITGVLSNFSGGATDLRTPIGQTVYYYPSLNRGLNRQTYRLKDLGGVDDGGVLAPVVSGGTVIRVR